jgi:hypothetical protein
MKIEFTTFDVSKLFRIDRTRLQEWIDAGFFTPSQKAEGKGTKALFTVNDLYRLRLFIWLLDIGKSRVDAKYDSDIDFSNVGPGPGQIKYGVNIAKVPLDKGRLRAGSFKIVDRTPDASMEGSDLFKMIVNLQAIKAEVDGLLR